MKIVTSRRQDFSNDVVSSWKKLLYSVVLEDDNQKRHFLFQLHISTEEYQSLENWSISTISSQILPVGRRWACSWCDVHCEPSHSWFPEASEDHGLCPRLGIVGFDIFIEDWQKVIKIPVFLTCSSSKRIPGEGDLLSAVPSRSFSTFATGTNGPSG